VPEQNLKNILDLELHVLAKEDIIRTIRLSPLFLPREREELEAHAK
jgi:hypothetical protein